MCTNIDVSEFELKYSMVNSDPSTRINAVELEHPQVSVHQDGQNKGT